MAEAHPNPDISLEPPAPSPERLTAFRGAYSMLMQLNAGEGSWDQSLVLDDSDLKVLDVKPFGEPNSKARWIQRHGDEPDLAEARTETYSEDLSSKTGLLGKFGVDKSGQYFDFYADGNIQVVHTAKDETGTLTATPGEWLTPEQTEELAREIESFQAQAV